MNTNVNGLYGSITIAADGSYTYVVNNNNATVQALRNSSNTLMDVFTYTMTDAAGSTSSQQISVTIQGSNDTPIAVSDGAIAVEAGGVGNSTVGSNGTGNVLANDTDVDSAAFGETKTVNGVVAGVAGTASGNVGSAVLGLYGSITLAADGSYSYAVNDSNSAVQALANSSQTLNDIFTYRMVDSSGHTSVTQLTITIQGANDTPTITSDGGGVTAAIAMSENIAAVTTVVGDDVDAGTTLTYTIIGGADAAKFTITAGGSLAFVTAPDFEFPTDVGGNNVYDVIVEVSDGLLATTQALAVTITDVSNFLMVTTDADINDSGIAAGAAFNIEWLNANRGADALVSLREAIIAANNTSGTDTVNFSITGTGVKTINLASALPAISDTIVINGYSQNGASANTLAIGNNAVLNIVLNGSGAGVGANGLSLAAGSTGSTISGLVIQNFSQHGISVSSGGNTISGNFIGVNATGAAGAANNFGVYINNVGSNTIGGTTAAARNLISGNTNDSVYIAGVSAAGNVIQGNYIGTNAAGTAAIANARHGIFLDSSSSGTTIGGSTAGAGNVVSGNTQRAILVNASNNNAISGNYIGTDRTGLVALGNGVSGGYSSVMLQGGSTGNVVGGNTANHRNVIAASGWAGVAIISSASNTVENNYIGTNLAGSAALGNAVGGVLINGAAATGNIVSTNVISGNSGNGVLIQNAASGNSLLGNIIGLNASGTGQIANTNGVRIENASSNTIGGTTASARNVISGNANDGVYITGASATGNLVQGNYIGTNVAGTAAIANGAMGCASPVAPQVTPSAAQPLVLVT